MISINKFRVLAVVEGIIPSVELVLAYPLEYLAEQGVLDYTLHVMPGTGLANELERCDLLLMMRCSKPEALVLVEEARKREIPVIYAIDDDFQALDPNTELGRYYLETKAWDRLLNICGKSTQVWAFSEALKNKIVPVQPHIVVPPAMASLEAIAALRGAPTPRSQGPRKVVGYAASKYHDQDLESIAPALLRLLDDMPFLEMEFVDVRCESLASHPRVSHFPKLPTITEYYSFVLGRQWDVGVAPLLRSAANDAKTDNKYREFAALGIPAVYSDAPPYYKSVIDGYNGIVAGDTDDWYDALASLLQDNHYAERIATNARDDVDRRYSIESIGQRYLHYMRSAMEPSIKVLVLAGAIPTTDIDLVRPLERLQAEGKVEWKLVLYPKAIAEEELAWADLLVVSRISDEAVMHTVRKAKRDFDLPLIFAWDDDFFSIPLSVGAVARHHRDPNVIRGLEELLRTAAVVKASTPLLAERSRLYSDRVIAVPYGFDFSQLDGIEHRHHADTGRVTIGFFGTLGHSAALEAVLGALRRVAVLAPHVAFEFFGPRSEKLESLPRTTFIPFDDSSTGSLRTLMSRKWDIGLGPLEINDFNRAKLPTKFRDYGACHIAGVYTRIDPYELVVRDGRTGLLVNDNKEDEWVEAIMRLVSDAPLRRNIAAQAHAQVRNELSLDQAVDGWRELLDRMRPKDEEGTEVLARYERKVHILEARLERMTRQLTALKGSARMLLAAQGQLLAAPEPPRGNRFERLLQRALNKALRLSLQRPSSVLALEPHPGVSATHLAQIVLKSQGREPDDAEIGLSANLQDVAYLEYPVTMFPVRGSKLQVAITVAVPTLGGNIGAEIVSPSNDIFQHIQIPIADLNPEALVEFPVEDLQIHEPGWIIRFFARDSESPLHVCEWTWCNVSGQRTALFTLRDKDVQVEQ